MVLGTHVSGFLTDGILDDSKFKSFYNLWYDTEDVENKTLVDFAAASTILISKYTNILNDYADSESFESLSEQIRQLIIRFNIIIGVNAYAVKYFTSIIIITLIFILLSVNFIALKVNIRFVLRLVWFTKNNFVRN